MTQSAAGRWRADRVFRGKLRTGEIEQMLQKTGRRDIMSARIAEHDWEAVTYAEISSRI